MLTPEQEAAVKKQLIKHIEDSFPEDKKQFAVNQIESMNTEQLEQFLIKNNLAKTSPNTSQSVGAGTCVFCSIVFGDINSYKIAENKKAIAVLEINPVSKGHVLIIPKEHITSQEGLPKEALNLAKKISSLIKTKLKPQQVRTEPSNIMGHEIINIIPLYEGQTTTERKPATPEELEELQKNLKKRDVKRKTSRKEKEKKENTIKKIVEKFEEKLWLPKRIP